MRVILHTCRDSPSDSIRKLPRWVQLGEIRLDLLIAATLVFTHLPICDLWDAAAISIEANSKPAEFDATGFFVPKGPQFILSRDQIDFLMMYGSCHDCLRYDINAIIYVNCTLEPENGQPACS